MDPARIEDRVARVRGRIADACGRSGRDPAGIRIVAVTKGHPAAVLTAALEAGLGEIGENRVQEAMEKFGEARAVLDARAPVRHLIGPLQRNKARDAVALFDWIQSVDSIRLARAVADRAPEDAPVPVLIEVNVTEAERRHGFAPGETVERAHEIAGIGALDVRGLMAMAPYTDDASAVRAAFATVRRLFEQAGRAVGPSLDTLSLGMSGDFEAAVEEGSTMVRLGTALFGER